MVEAAAAAGVLVGCAPDTFLGAGIQTVKAAIDAGAEAAGRVGQVVSVHVIPRPHDELGGMMPKTKRGSAPVAAGARK